MSLSEESPDDTSSAANGSVPDLAPPDSLSAAHDEQLHQKLLESEANFRMMAEIAPISILISRASDGIIVYVNRKLSELYQVPMDESVGRTTFDFYTDLDHRDVLLERLRSNGKLEDYELRTQRGDGQVVWLSVSARMITYHGEECLFAALLDITRRKRAEQALREERHRLRGLLDFHEQERRLVAYDIHDGLVQDMAAAKMFLESLGPAASTPPEQVDETIMQCREMLRNSIGEARRLINGLRPPVLEESGLIAGIENLIDDITGRSGLTIEFQHAVEFDRLTPGMETAIYRIVQESLTNVWKHSQSPRARVQIEQRADWVMLTVRDWGIGFDPEKIAAGHYGIEGIRERVRLLDGRWEIQSEAGQGTTLHVELPLVMADEASP